MYEDHQGKGKGRLFLIHPLKINGEETLDAPFVRFAPAALNSFQHPGGGGGTHFRQQLLGGSTKILW